MPEDAAVVAKAMGDLDALTGATGETLQALTLATLKASRALGEDGAESAGDFARALNLFNRPAEEGVAIMDDLFTIADETGTSLGKLINTTTTYGAVLANVGFTMEESAGLFGQLSSIGDGMVSRVMPGLNAAFRNWSKEGLDARDMLAQTVEAMKNATKRGEALNIATEAFGAEGAARLTAAVRSGKLALDDLTVGLSDNEGAVQRASDATKTYAQKFDELKNKVMLLLEPLGVQLLGIFDKMLPLIEGGITRLQNFSTAWIESGDAARFFSTILIGTLQAMDIAQTSFQLVKSGLMGMARASKIVERGFVDLKAAFLQLSAVAMPQFIEDSSGLTGALESLRQESVRLDGDINDLNIKIALSKFHAGEWSKALDDLGASITAATLETTAFTAAQDEVTTKAPALVDANNAVANSFFNVAAAVASITQLTTGGFVPDNLRPPAPPPGAYGSSGSSGSSSPSGFVTRRPGAQQVPGQNIPNPIPPNPTNPFPPQRPGPNPFPSATVQITVNAQGSIFEDDRSLSRLADKIAAKMVQSGRLGATAGAF